MGNQMEPQMPESRRSFKEDDLAQTGPVKTIAVGAILVVISLVVALTVLPILTSAVATSQGDANVSASDSTLLGLIPTLVIVSLLLGGVAFMFQGFKGLKGG